VEFSKKLDFFNKDGLLKSLKIGDIILQKSSEIVKTGDSKSHNGLREYVASS